MLRLILILRYYDVVAERNRAINMVLQTCIIICSDDTASLKVPRFDLRRDYSRLAVVVAFLFVVCAGISSRYQLLK